MAFLRVKPTSITNQVNQTGSASQLQDDPETPDNDWVIATDPADSGSCRINFENLPAEPLAPNSDMRLALFVRNSRDTGRSADWGGNLTINGGVQSYTRQAVNSAVGEYQESILNLTGGFVVTSAFIDLDWTRSGGGASVRTGLDFDSVELVFEIADIYDFPFSEGIGRGNGQGTFDILPIELGTADGAGAGAGDATAQLIPPTELNAGDGNGVGTGSASLDLVPPVEMAGTSNGVGTGTSDMDQLPYDMGATASGVGTGSGAMQSIPQAPVLDLTIDDPTEGQTIFGLYTIVVSEADPAIPFVRVGINPAGERPPYGYVPTRIDVPDGTHELDWSTSAYAGQSIDIEATAAFQGGATGQGVTGFQVTGGWGVQEPALNSPVNVDVVSGAFIEFQGTGAGAGDGSATMELVPPVELAADGAGVGTGTASDLVIDMTTGDGEGVGTGLATLSLLIPIAGEAHGDGIGSATMDTFFDMSASGQGVGIGGGNWEGIINMNATGTGRGSSGLNDFDLILNMEPADGTGVGIGTAAMSLAEGIIWQDPADGTDDDPWNPALWNPFVQTPASINATATIQNDTNEMTNDPDPPALDFGLAAGDRIVASSVNILEDAQAMMVNDPTSAGIATVPWRGTNNAFQPIWIPAGGNPTPWGGGYLRCRADRTANLAITRMGATNERFSLPPDSDYTALIWMRVTQMAIPTARVNLGYYAAIGGAFIGQAGGAGNVPVPLNEWRLIATQFHTPVNGGNPVWMNFDSRIHRLAGDVVANDEWHVGGAALIEGHYGPGNGDVTGLIPMPPVLDAPVGSTDAADFTLINQELKTAGPNTIINELNVSELHHKDNSGLVGTLSVAEAIDNPAHADPVGTIWTVEGVVDQVDNGGAYHSAIHPPTDSVRLDFVVSTTTDPNLSSRQAVYLNASGPPNINGVPQYGLRILIEDPTNGDHHAVPQLVNDYVVTPLGPAIDLSLLGQPYHLVLARSGALWAMGVWGQGQTEDDIVVVRGTEPNMQFLPDGVTLVNTYNFGTADFRYDDFVLSLLPYVDHSASGVGVGIGQGAMGLVGDDTVNLNARGIGVGIGEGTMSAALSELVGNGVGVGTGTAFLELITKDIAGNGLGVGTGLATFTVTRTMEGAGVGVGTGWARWNTGNWQGGGADIPGGSSDADILEGSHDSDVDPHRNDAEVEGGAGTVRVTGGSGSTGEC